MDATWTENTILYKAYHISREEIVALKAAVDILMKTLDENTTTTIPPLLETMTSSTMM
jgi:hypothetical protein